MIAYTLLRRQYRHQWRHHE